MEYLCNAVDNEMKQGTVSGHVTAKALIIDLEVACL